ncbi:hypothetical protein RKE30_24510 [Streptomyces sp. Li-HN-5-11]|uniref:hypothetical protein n=1 Tax=Streptomyces sp. Li-HN-5-11 TaxID=3075432 RepID=UPI0028AB919B|nr:hypothetical protein [Streptomyces sp. Li-HN-5-11]WNM33323.1 hypothetical protein RKE30_24510 [Streptomyces sp. Li-HN-5-11]
MRTPRTLPSGLVLVLPAVAALAGPPAAAAHAGDGSRTYRAAPLPSSFTWTSTGPLIAPRPDAAHPIVSVKDPTVFRCRNRRHLCATTAGTSCTRGWTPP